MVELIPGESKQQAAGHRLWERLVDSGIEGTLYLGYPVFADADGRLSIDALLLSKEHSAVVFSFDDASAGRDEDALRREQDALYVALEQRLKTFEPLRKGRDLSVPIHTVGVIPTPGKMVMDEGFNLVSEDRVCDVIGQLTGVDDDEFVALNAAIQRVKTIRPSRKRTNVTKPESRGGVMNSIEKHVANLDYWQNAAAIGSPDGPQRIRGIAGSGKTIVLALKAAYLHVANPDWTICVTFQTRSLYEQFRDLTRRFCFEQTNEDPDWSKLLIRHAWGSSRDPGVYAEVAAHYDAPLRDFAFARREHGGSDRAFDGVCREFVELTKNMGERPLYDALLIDEAQDFPQSFFELAYKAVSQPKRIVWAYDELQNLGNYEMLPPEKLFGTNAAGEHRITDLVNVPGQPITDAILPVCYRNTPWALTMAHALGLGIYRAVEPVQLYSTPGLWDSIGYRVLDGSLLPDHEVTLERKPESTPGYVRELLTAADSVSAHTFASAKEQAEWVASEVARNLNEDELQHRDILIIIPDPITAKAEAAVITEALNAVGVTSHLAGVTSSRDQLFVDGSIAISGIFRAKGNEAPMVYVLNSQFGYSGHELIKKRNILFTAITRSRAWVRICGIGQDMDSLRQEFDAVVNQKYRLHFRVPTDDELARLRRVHGEMSPEEKTTQAQLEQLLAGLTDDAAIRRLPPEMQDQLRLMLGDADDDDA